MRNFIITYNETKKYGMKDLKRKVTISKATGEIGIDAKVALGVFINSTGTLKRNEIVSIQEIDEEGNFIGEPIVPTGENAVIPTNIMIM